MIYFAQAQNSGDIKIGTTISLKWRLHAIKRQRNEPLGLLGVMQGRHKVERGLHRRFAHLALGHEWFTPGKEILEFIRLNTVAVDEYQEPAPALNVPRLEQHFTPKEAARFLGVPPATVKEWARSGQIKAVIIGKMIRVSRSEIIRLGGQVTDENGD